MKKIKVFLGGYVNYSNAQNLNCKSIAESLDKNKFEVYALRTHYGNNKSFTYRTFFCFRPFRITSHLGFLWGFIRSDVMYLPKHIDTPSWVLKISNFFKKPIFTTIEGNVSDLQKKHNLLSLFASKEKMQEHFYYFNDVYAITEDLILNSNNIINVSRKTLKIGVNITSKYSIKDKINSIIYVGNLTKNKCVDEFLKLAVLFPKLDFNIIGDGPERIKLLKLATDNVNFLGFLDNDQVFQVLQKSDILFLPSKSEGFPKVILEAASVGIPSIVYNTYGASNWMDNNINGFIVNDLKEVKDLIHNLLVKPEFLEQISKNVISLAQKYDWKLIIKDWEKIIENLFYEK